MRGVTYKYELANKAVEFNTVPAAQLSQKQIDDSKVIGNRGNEIVLLKNKPVKTSIEEKHSLGNIAWRLSIWKQTLNFAKDSPLFGKGFGVYPDYEIWGGIHQSPKGIYLNSRIVPAHNDLITVFFKMGIFGLAIFLFLNIYVFIFASAYLKKCRSRFIYNLLVFLLGSFIFWHVLALFFDTIDSPPTNIVLWIIMGLIFLAVGNDKGLAKNV
jgi:O-antigen ligase